MVGNRGGDPAVEKSSQARDQDEDASAHGWRRRRTGTAQATQVAAMPRGNGPSGGISVA